MTESFNAETILEVGSGPGLHSEFIARNYLKRGALLVSCDFSKDMMIAMKERYLKSEFLIDTSNTVHIDTDSDYPENKDLVID